ncbi:hypothetical protein ID858_10340 [Xenorhabdus sp. DI]|uniref:hypothetical protein n=1 Tax=Xenorhabdus doucetiae TaxID=351671 RepID=UPI0019C2A9A2|nr:MULTISPECIES: hypothetical protein [unclassified Xenorhabdus]MBD2786336.1 hypothetical protein [Xenorhabdus sp. 3]MBD2788909.1 hypothetical protein [Xenorhabdus sp. DI]
MPNTFENGRRQVARECRAELKRHPKRTAQQTNEILTRYLPRFEAAMSPHQKSKFQPVMWLRYYVDMIDKEMK